MIFPIVFVALRLIDIQLILFLAFQKNPLKCVCRRSAVTLQKKINKTFYPNILLSFGLISPCDIIKRMSKHKKFKEKLKRTVNKVFLISPNSF